MSESRISVSVFLELFLRPIPPCRKRLSLRECQTTSRPTNGSHRKLWGNRDTFVRIRFFETAQYTSYAIGAYGWGVVGDFCGNSGNAGNKGKRRLLH